MGSSGPGRVVGGRTCRRGRCHQSAHNLRRHAVNVKAEINKTDKTIQQTGLGDTGPQQNAFGWFIQTGSVRAGGSVPPSDGDLRGTRGTEIKRQDGSRGQRKRDNEAKLTWGDRQPSQARSKTQTDAEQMLLFGAVCDSLEHVACSYTTETLVAVEFKSMRVFFPGSGPVIYKFSGVCLLQNKKDHRPDSPHKNKCNKHHWDNNTDVNR